MATQKPLIIDSGIAQQIPTTDQLLVPNGAAATPAVVFNSNTTRGIFNDTTNNGIGFSVNGIQIAYGIAAQWVFTRTGGGYIMDVQSEGLSTWRTTSYGGGNNTARMQIRYAEGTIASPTVIATGRDVGSQNWLAYDGSAFTAVSTMTVTMTEPTPGVGAIGARMVFSIAPVGGTNTEILRYEHATGLSMFGANPVIDQNRTHVLRSYTTASPPTLVTGGLTFDSTYNAPIYGGATTRRLAANGHPLVTTPTAGKLINRLSIAPSQNLEQLIRRTFDKLNAAGLWTKLKGFWVFADPYSEFAAADGLINWATPGTGDATVTGTVTYTAGQGRTGDGSTGRLDTVVAMNTAGAAQDNVAIGAYVRTAGTSAKAIWGQSSGNRRQIYQMGNALTVQPGMSNNPNVADIFTPGAYTGLHLLFRTASTGFQRSLDGAAGTTITRTSSSLPNGTPVQFLGTADATGTEYSDAQLSYGFLGGSTWTDTDSANLYSIMQFWLGAKTGLTVARLPTVATLGDTLIVTDALAPTFLASVVGGGAVITPVFYNGTNWVGY